MLQVKKQYMVYIDRSDPQDWSTIGWRHLMGVELFSPLQFPHWCAYFCFIDNMAKLSSECAWRANIPVTAKNKRTKSRSSVTPPGNCCCQAESLQSIRTR